MNSAVRSLQSNKLLDGQRIALTGKLLSLPRFKLNQTIREEGGTITASVSRRTNRLVVGMGGWPLLPSGEVGLALRRAEELQAQGAPIRISSEVEFLEEIGLKQSGPALEKIYSPAEICELTGVNVAKLRRWEQLGLIRSSGGNYDYQDLISLRTITDLVERGVRPEVINRSLRGLSSILPGTDRPLAQLEIVLENSTSLVAELGGCRITAEGQFVLDFEEPLASPLRLSFGHETEDAETWMIRAQSLEETDQLEQAADAYRRAIGLDPTCAEAFFHLGNVLRAQERPDAAVELFKLALSLDPSLCEAWYNVADIHDEQGRLQDAIECLKQAITASSTYADAYYNLALCFEKVGEQRSARSYWSEYLRLDPNSEWSDIARAHIQAIC